MDETLADIGEFGLIHRIDELIRKEGVRAPGVSLGIGDDCASFLPRSGYELLVTCDSMLEDRHYLPEHISPLDLGGRAMALNISDIGAMGGQPLYALISLGLRGDTSARSVETMYRGFLAELSPLGASIVGGNLTKSGGGNFIDITLIGEVEKGRAVRRSTARVGDRILVTGYPGQAAAGLKLLLSAKPDEDLADDPLVRAYTRPSHRAREGQAIGRSGFASAMIDTSDGLLGDLGHICGESGVGALLIQKKLPISKSLGEAALKLGLDPYDLVLQESDDYELIITVPPERADQVRSLVVPFSSVPVTEVGRITDVSDGMTLVLPDGTERSLIPTGWDHFTRSG